MATKKEKAFQLFAKGLTPRDAEAKKLVPNAGTRRNYYLYWRQQQGLPRFIETEGEGETEIALPTVPESETAAEIATHIPEGPKAPALKAPVMVMPKEINIGEIKIPFSDWGYSSTQNLLLVAATYEEVCKPESEGGFGYTGKVGDFCADCVKLFRRLFDFDERK